MANLPKVSNQPSSKDMQDFLSKVDEIENVIKGLNSNEEEKRNFYMSKADDMIKEINYQNIEKKKYENQNEDDNDLPETKTGFSKTLINKDCYKNDNEPVHSTGPILTDNMDQKAFMAAMEADAKERSERKKEREIIANVLKEQGNTEYNQGNYQRALDMYCEAINQIRDSSVLYTNRAQARIKLGLYKDALKDCDLAIRLWPNCMKAYVHQGHAYLNLKEYDKARESYKYILTLDPKKENMVKEYITDVNRAEEASQQEAKAAQLFDAGNELANSVVEILSKINQKDQLPLYYSGGFRLLSSVLKDTNSQTLFRTHRGFELPVEHHFLKRILSLPLNNLSCEEKDVMHAAFEMLTTACKENETNQQLLFSHSDLPMQILAILLFNFKGQDRLLKIACLNLLYETSLTPTGRATIVKKFDADRLTAALFSMMMKSSTYGSTAAAVFNNIALDNRLKSHLRDRIEENILPAFESLLKSNTLPVIVSLVTSAATNLSCDQPIRNKMASRQELWKNIGHLLEYYTNSKLIVPMEYLLGLLLNLSTAVLPTSLQSVSTDVTKNCHSIIVSGNLSDLAVSRALSVMSNLLPHCDSAVSYMCKDERPLLLLDFMKKQDPAFYKPALKCLSVLTQNSEQVRQMIADNKGTSVLLNFLTIDDEVVIGNAALCLSHLSQLKKICSKLTETNVIQKLLDLARDGKKPTVQSNCAILVGKLVQGDSRHLERLRELHGIEILHGCMKYLK